MRDAPPVDRIVALDRRGFLALGGGLAVGVAIGGAARAEAQGASGALNAYVAISPDGNVEIVTPGAEMGQGIADALPRIVAEELDADWSRVTVRLSGASPAFAAKNKRQRSANSDGITSYYDLLRQVGASARAMLVTTAAARWGVDPATITTRDSRLIHAASGRTLGYGDVATEAAKLPVPTGVPLKDADSFRLIGKNFPRKDIPAKVRGAAPFGMDLVLPDMLYAAVRHVPVAGGTLAPFASEPALGIAGVRKVVTLDNAVGVIADRYWQAHKGALALDLAAQPGPRIDSAILRQRIVAGLERQDGILPFPVGFDGQKPDMGASADVVDAALAAAPIKVEATYEVPYLAHATMEPLCCTALVRADSCEIWGPLQCADVVAPELAKITGLAAQAVTVNRTYLGGGFGRKNERDFVHQAVRLAMAVPGRPVMLIWPRDEDMRNDFYRPGFAARLTAGVEQDGRISAMRGRISGQPLSTMSQFRFPGLADGAVAGGLLSPDYRLGAQQIEGVEIEGPVRTGYWRSVSGSQNGFFSEAIIDEIAAKLKRDPLEYRLAIAKDDPRTHAVLKLVGEKSGWGKPMAKGQGRGVALATGWGSRCAMVVEVAVKDKVLRVTRIVCAFDCGQQVAPDNIVSQLEGAAIFGLSAALFGKITLKDGAVVEGSFGDYPVVLMRSTPQIEVHLVDSGAPVGGVGEAGVPAIAPALCGAIHAATGRRIRALPIIDAGFEVTA
ncbi:molybdopterin cofactor-binding domain-containing protein [Sphingobium sp. CR2-8]|uniref:xanthine dehydrogenase family protein molybdopterin-binding subunit n=1 Tax=Sphingobium sp. CR2-8 TaxID=1306534 RepID=UPI002DB5C039|nr:molybdopterin cofactor-binding domain-containing protein [Sphingobium sp. CR2-8]MEC3911421.1 molybdopterin cofactor-binding domain-containing protein [Sphingobium sp. CR2-8]